MRVQHKFSPQLPSAAKPGTMGRSAQRHHPWFLQRVFSKSEGLTELKYLKGKVTVVFYFTIDFRHLNSSPFYVSGCARSQLMFQCQCSLTLQ